VGKDVTSHYDGSTPGDQFGVYGDNNNILNETNWIPKTSFKEGLIKMINWSNNNL
jgi:UDP-glucose 4-epimerase